MPLLNTGVDEWAGRIRSEYLEMPGLSLTRRQMCRLWCIDRETCDAVVDRLVMAAFLRRRANHSYVRVEGAANVIGSAEQLWNGVPPQLENIAH